MLEIKFISCIILILWTKPNLSCELWQQCLRIDLLERASGGFATVLQFISLISRTISKSRIFLNLPKLSEMLQQNDIMFGIRVSSTDFLLTWIDVFSSIF